jgi:predicted small lipoprotein YifL
MKKFLAPALAAAFVTLTACGGQGDDSLGDNAAEAADARADNLEDAADNLSGAAEENLQDQAEAARDQGERAEERIDDSDVDASELSAGQRNAVVNGQ